MNKDQKNNLAEALGIPKDEQVVLDAGSNHPYTCKCQVCLAWWVLMGSEEPGQDSYGPFNIDEINAAKHRMATEYDINLIRNNKC